MPQLQQMKAIRYMDDTCHRRQEIGNFQRAEIKAGPTYKRYPLAPRISLPKADPPDQDDLTSVLRRRRSKRDFSLSPLPLQDLAYMLWASQGITASAGRYPLRTAPSAGALYPVETYLSIENVDGISPGLYHFAVLDFSLELLQSGHHGDDIALACLNQQFLARAGVIFIWTAVFRRNFSKYGERGLRYVLMDVGHICQNVLLAAEATGSTSCPIAAFFDEELHQILDVDGREERVLYLAGVGLTSRSAKG
ncbi:MAG: SagB/ThcOx family dehydrogenase [Desulfopila sp.]